MLQNFTNNNGHKIPNWFKYGLCCTFIAVVVLTTAIRIRLLTVPIERDEGEYAYAGQLMLQGFPPYEKAYNMKMPGIYAMYCLILASFGQTHIGVHLGLLFVNVITILLVFLLTKELFGIVEGLTAGAAFAILSLDRAVLGYTANSEHFVIVFVLAGILLLHKAVKLQKWMRIFASALLLGTAYLMKQHGAAFILFAAFYLLVNEIRCRPFNWQLFMKKGILFSTGVFIPFILTCLILWQVGVFERFWFWTFHYALEYVSQVQLSMGLSLFQSNLARIINPAVGFWVLAAIGLLSLFLSANFRAQRFFTIGFLIASFLDELSSTWWIFSLKNSKL